MRAHQRRAFSLIELVIVIVIIGIIGAIAIPKMSRGAAGAADSALKANLALIRNAIDLFQTEHAGTFPTLANISTALTQYSNETGSTIQATKDGPGGVIFGPYLRSIPPLPVGTNKGKSTFVGVLGGDGGWFYTAGTGAVQANCPTGEIDERGRDWNTY